MTAAIDNPFPFFLDRSGLPLDGGEVFIGVAGQDPVTAPQTVYLDAACLVAASQPISVIGGLLCNDGNPVPFYTAADNYSILVREEDGSQVFYAAQAVVNAAAWQPLDSDLTAIAALATTPYGRALLTQGSAASLRSYAGVVDSIPTAGGTTTGNIVRSGAGPHLYHVDGSFTSGRVFVTVNGAADPTSLVGDIWLELAP